MKPVDYIGLVGVIMLGLLVLWFIVYCWRSDNEGISPTRDYD